MRILVVEDEPLTAHVIQAVIGDCGHQAIAVHSLADATATILSTVVHGAILDVNLPDGASYAIARALRSQSIPFFFATGQFMGDHVGFHDVPVVQKPFDRAALFAAIIRLETLIPPAYHHANSVKSSGTSP